MLTTRNQVIAAASKGCSYLLKLTDNDIIYCLVDELLETAANGKCDLKTIEYLLEFSPTITAKKLAAFGAYSKNNFDAIVTIVNSINDILYCKKLVHDSLEQNHPFKYEVAEFFAKRLGQLMSEKKDNLTKDEFGMEVW